MNEHIEEHCSVEARTESAPATERQGEDLSASERDQPAPSATRPDRGTFLPADWRPSTEDRAFAIEKGLDPPAIEHVAEEFKSYWTGESGQRARKRDWHATWRNRVINVVARQRRQAPRSGSYAERMEETRRVYDIAIGRKPN